MSNLSLPNSTWPERREPDAHGDPGATEFIGPQPNEPQGPDVVMTANRVERPQGDDGHTSANVSSSQLFINRELSWLEFNARVLAEATNPEVPLFERLKFLGIFSSNLDEFFMVRAAGLLAQLSGDVDEVPPDGMAPRQQLHAISKRAHELMDTAYSTWNHKLRPALKQAGIALVTPEELSPAAQRELDEHFEREIFPVLTPIAIDPVHPFPHVRNKSINVGIIFGRRGVSNEPSFGVVQLPTTLPRLLPVPHEGALRAYVALEHLIFRHSAAIFPQMPIAGQYAFRVTRNFDIQIDDDEAEDLLITLQAELRRRERGNAVRLQVDANAPDDSISWLCKELGLDAQRDVYRHAGPLFLGALTGLIEKDKRREFRDESFSPQYVPPLRDSDDFFETLRSQDVLLHHPYESFEAVVDFLWQAAEDPDVLAIKQTLYRTGGESPLVRALQRAAELGKQVTVLVELKARFDEESNIQWARALERSGVNVMYGLLGLKTHCKVLLVVRRETGGLRRYVHLATGNYNQQTAKLYEDLSLFTSRETFAEDCTALFNLLTGYSAPKQWKELIIAPLGLHEAILGLIQRETTNARAGKKGRIIAKMNSLVDREVAEALYAASRAGVKIDLIVRGICCLRPRVPGVSDNIRVYTVIDRFLEHARIFYFDNGGSPEIYLSSADWMPRNFRRRIETMFPVVDPGLKKRLHDEVLTTMRKDNVKGWELGPDGSYARVQPDGRAALRSQARFMELARDRAREKEPLLGIGSPRPAPAPSDALEQLRKARKKRKRGKKYG